MSRVSVEDGMKMADDCLGFDLSLDEQRLVSGLKNALYTDGRISVGAYNTLRSLWERKIAYGKRIHPLTSHGR